MRSRAKHWRRTLRRSSWQLNHTHDPNQVCLVGSFGEGNFGNEWTLDAFLSIVREISTEVDFTILCNNPTGALSQRLPSQSIVGAEPLVSPFRPDGPSLVARVVGRLKDFGWLYRLIGRMDLVAVPGTGILERLYMWPGGYPATLALIAFACRLRRVPFALVGIGADFPDSELSRVLLRFTLQSASLVTVRDDHSRRSIVSMTSGRVVPKSHADLVLTAAIRKPPDGLTHKSGVVALGVMDYRGSITDPHGDAVAVRYRRRIVDLASALIADGWSLRLIAGDVDDIEAAEWVVSALRDDGRLTGDRCSIASLDGLDGALSELSAAEVVVATRYHTLVAAVAVGRPVVSLGYARKNSELMTSVGLAQFAHSVDEFEVELVLAQVRALVSRESGSVLEYENSCQSLLGGGVPGLASLLNRETPQ